ncbi:MAG TPA: LL-diaminopimelate aminotransferase, partial [Selenomonas sp.]|nr:LL-diaminopimelate aminotransferase [Selenomonas sp.]
ELFGQDNVAAITDPVYPVYLDSNVMAGRTGDLRADGHYDNVV